MFDQVVFAGGGNRCWWQAGFWDVVQPKLDLRPRVITGISAGAATACMIYTRDSQWVMRYYEEALKHNKRNAYWGNLLRGESVFPHYRIYRQALLDIYGPRFEKLQDAPEIRIGVSHLPRWLGARSAVAAGLIAYNIEKHIRKTLHPTLGRKLGFHPEFVTAQACANVDDLADLVLQSSCTPPFTPVLRRNGRAVLDGGMVDNVPVGALDDTPGRVLVMVTRLYPRPQMFVVKHRTGGDGGEPGEQLRLYVQPTAKVPISSWDYTSPQQMQHAWNLGAEDGERFLARLPEMFEAATHV
ncbi:patatin-like phospholipase family protein [Paraburkholderia sp. Ac-20347]|uniref:patatin-like phospholipase family protein n=1 Tax=Paraburkholderia sp. Ac-20347 TaxID=2703892 RepID=UPI001980B85A|nr:patatin-like phospholipase family protein [Paraburkholderia sp. Ac-20347]MBN3808727.1 patatin-like phospholipase family protein [Paraburkholderia sp. Ac-20347]